MRMLGAADAQQDYLDYFDEAVGIYRAALIVEDRLEGCLYVSRRPQLPARTWLASLFGAGRLDDTDRTALLAGRPIGRAPDAGPHVCACFRVGRRAIREAIAAHALTSAREVGARLRAGTSCGSCVPEIRALIAERG